MDLTDELTNGPLAVELAQFVASADEGSLQAIKSAFHRKDIAILGNLSVHDIKQYISLIGLRLPIMDASAESCREFNTALEDFKDSGFDLANPLIYSRVEQVLDALVAEVLIPDFTEEHKTTLLSLGMKAVSRAEQLGVSVDLSSLARAIFNDDGTKKI